MTTPLMQAVRAAMTSGLVAAAVVSSSCAIPSGASNAGDVPDQKSFLDNDVSAFMEARCGGLDCHGQVGRPLRIYSSTGLRKTANKDGTRNASPTTDDEKKDNYIAVVGLEPENLALCYATKGADFSTFQLLKKPLDIVGQGIRHKGGPVLRATENDPGWQCLYGWASGKVDKSQCDDGAKVP
jgi:hypothetical protein